MRFENWYRTDLRSNRTRRGPGSVAGVMAVGCDACHRQPTGPTVRLCEFHTERLHSMLATLKEICPACGLMIPDGIHAHRCLILTNG